MVSVKPGFFRRKAADKRMADEQLAIAWQVISLLLEYPDRTLVERRALLAQAVSGLPGPVGGPLGEFLSSVQEVQLGELQREYVETFDVTRKCCLYLSYFSCGDTRKRGVALVQFKQAYRKAGVEFDESDELPDHLSVVLEFGAAYDLNTAWRLLTEHRAGIEMLRMALADRRDGASRWLPVVQALSATLPELKGDDAEILRALIAQGPPSEEVGLDQSPYSVQGSHGHGMADPQFYADPRLAPLGHQSKQFIGTTIGIGEPR